MTLLTLLLKFVNALFLCGKENVLLNRKMWISVPDFDSPMKLSFY